jgi:DNA-binding Xre family transcriptional regulator
VIFLQLDIDNIAKRCYCVNIKHRYGVKNFLEGGEHMTLNRGRIDIVLARKKMSVTALAKAYGVSRTRMNVILNSKAITPICAGRLADALNVDVTEIMETEN